MIKNIEEVFAKPAVSAIIVKYVDDVKYVLVQERAKGNGEKEDGVIEIPGGKIREYENVFESLRREVFEETGLTITKINGEEYQNKQMVNISETIEFTPFCVVQNLSGVYSLMNLVFICEAEGEPVKETNETKNIRWETVEWIRDKLNNEPEAFYPTDVLSLKKYVFN